MAGTTAGIRLGPTEADLRSCIHCGMCLQACPTYRITGLETESPRGRIHLMDAVRTGRAPLTSEVTIHFDRCLACRACEIVCPAGVPYGRLIEETRVLQAERGPASAPIARILRALFLDWLLPYPRRLGVIARGLSVYERAGLRALLRRSGAVRLLPRRIRMLEGLMPPLTRRPFSLARGGIMRARDGASGRAALITGCVMSVAYGDVHDATARLLSRARLDVVVPSEQLCCGALHAHSGARDGAIALAKRNIVAFERAGVDVIVANAAGCGAHLKLYGELLAHEPEWAARAEAFSAKVRDLSEVLVDGLRDVPLGPLQMRVTYQDACHLAHAQGIREQPRALLRRIEGLDLVETPDSDRCCGSAGIYNVVQTEYAWRLLDAKMRDLRSTSAEAVVSANPGCMLQLRFGVERDGMRMSVYHLAEVLDAAARVAERT